MIKSRLNQLKSKFKFFNIDGYIIPKNDEFFSEYSSKDRLKFISNFDGSAGVAVVLKNKNYLFVDGRYTIQAEKQCGKLFKIINYDKILNCNLFKNLTLGIDPKIFTSNQIKKTFIKYNKIKEIELNLVDFFLKQNNFNIKPFFSLEKNVTGLDHYSKIKKVSNILKKYKSKYLFISAPENISWLLNIRGYDNPNSPITNARLLIDNKEKIFLISQKDKLKKIIKDKKINLKQVINPKNFLLFINKLQKGKIIIDDKTCSIYFENLIKKKFKILKKEDPVYNLKSVKNKVEIKNMIKCHVADGVAVTKFLYWIKRINKKKITEYQAQKKLEFFRKKIKDYQFPSFNTIAGTGKNGAIIHYKPGKKNSSLIKKEDIFLCDSGGQYRFGTTDVTRTICFTKPKKNIKSIFTKVLKGHIAVATANLNKYFNGKKIDVLARKSLKKIGLNYEHGTGHGVGFYLNVHEGPQAISKFNEVRIKEGMILSNEPGFYKKGQFGIRIENLIYVIKKNNKLKFKNLTLVPIEKDLINFQELSKKERDYLFIYHLDVYTKLSRYLSLNERKWLASYI